MHLRNVSIALLVCVVASCATVSRPPYAKPVTPPLAAASCAPLPEGLRLYGGVPFAQVEVQGRFPLQHLERHFLETNNHLWVHFREDLRPTDLIFEYVLDDEWEDEGKFYQRHSGGLTAFRNGCTVRTEQVWTT